MVEREALLSERRPREVAAQALEARAVTAVERDLRMHVDPTDLGQGSLGEGMRRTG